MIQRFLLVCLHHFIKICMISILPLCIGQIEASTCPPGKPPGQFKLVYILNLESVTILLSKNKRKLNSINLKTAVNVTKKVCHVTKKLTLSPFCLHKKSHFGKIFVSKQPLENRIRLESNFEHDFFGGLSQ